MLNFFFFLKRTGPKLSCERNWSLTDNCYCRVISPHDVFGLMKWVLNRPVVSSWRELLKFRLAGMSRSRYCLVKRPCFVFDCEGKRTLLAYCSVVLVCRETGPLSMKCFFLFCFHMWMYLEQSPAIVDRKSELTWPKSFEQAMRPLLAKKGTAFFLTYAGTSGRLTASPFDSTFGQRHIRPEGNWTFSYRRSKS